MDRRSSGPRRTCSAADYVVTVIDDAPARRGDQGANIGRRERATAELVARDPVEQAAPDHAQPANRRLADAQVDAKLGGTHREDDVRSPVAGATIVRVGAVGAAACRPATAIVAWSRRRGHHCVEHVAAGEAVVEAREMPRWPRGPPATRCAGLIRSWSVPGREHETRLSPAPDGRRRGASRRRRRRALVSGRRPRRFCSRAPWTRPRCPRSRSAVRDPRPEPASRAPWRDGSPPARSAG